MDVLLHLGEHALGLSRLSGEPKKSSVTIASSSWRCFISTCRIATGSDMPKPAFSDSTVLMSSRYLLGAVEHAAELPRLRLVRAAYREEVRRAVDARHVVDEPLQTAAALGAVRQQIDAVAQHRAAEGLEHAEDLHPAGRVVDRQLGDHRQPAPAVGGGRLRGFRRGARHYLPRPGADA